eukprot:m.122312 g.122312  ORF g.122312 m.122312 type:complete len:135 (-) comp13728_c1_seq1:2030-2434(-)
MQLQDKVPPSIIRALQSPGAPGDASRSPSNVTNIVIGNNKVALRAAETKAVALGFTTRIISSTLSGEVSDVASSLFDTIRAMAQSLSQPTCLLYGGETTVNVVGKGVGGRNQVHLLCFHTPSILIIFRGVNHCN